MSYEILKSTERNVAKFKEIYSEDRFKARIYCFEHTPSEDILSINKVSDDNFQIFRSTKKYGVSKTMKLYARKTDNAKYLVNKTKFYKIERGRLFPMCLANIEEDILQIFIDQFTWIRFLKEFGIRTILFNTIVKNKLYSRDKVLRYMYGCKADIALQLLNKFSLREWRDFKKTATGVENFNTELLDYDSFGILTDAARLAFKLNETINVSWSKRRLKEEHDKWSKKYTEIALEIDNRPLNIHPVFTKFNEFIGGGILLSTKELAIEGNRQRHCVATYSHSVDSGRTAIFNLNGYTAEIVKSGNKIELRQFKGFKNQDAPIELTKLIRDKLNEFSDIVDKSIFTQQHIPVHYSDPTLLPF